MNPEQPLNSRSRMDLEAKGGITDDLGKKTNSPYADSENMFWSYLLSAFLKSKFYIFMVLSQESDTGF